MGLNIGMVVSSSLGPLRVDDIAAVEAEFFDDLASSFPRGGFARGRVRLSSDSGREGLLFDVAMGGYGRHFEETGHSIQEMYDAIFRFVMHRYMGDELNLRVYYA